MTVEPRDLAATPLLQEALERLRLEGAIFFRSELTEPFAFESTPSALADLLHPGATRVILFHIVARGTCWVAGDDGERHWAEPGDVIVLPYGDHHVIGSTLQGKIPLPYARSSLSTERSPPRATNPFSEPIFSARLGSGNHNRLSRMITLYWS